MKFYISAKWQLKDVVREMEDVLKRKGHEITSKWTERAYGRSYEENRDMSAEYSEEEVDEILESDVLIHLSDMEGGKGKYVDLGIALAGNALQGRPQIYVLGEAANESQFYFHPEVQRIVTEDPVHTLEGVLVLATSNFEKE